MYNGLQSQQDSMAWYQQKLQACENKAENYRCEWENCKKELANTKMRLTLDKAKLTQSLQGTFHEVETLHKEVYKKKLV